MIKSISFKGFSAPSAPVQRPEKHPENKKIEQCTDKNKDNGCQPLKPLEIDQFVKTTNKDDKKPKEALKDVLKNDLTNK